MAKKHVIALCSSISFYKQLVKIGHQLEHMGFAVLVPQLARLMEKQGDYRLKSYLSTFYANDFLSQKGQAIKGHFQEIARAHAILVINLAKNGRRAYIGPNALMEMGLSFYLNKPIFIWNKVSKSSPFADEIFAMKPIFINRDLHKINLD